MDESLVSQLIVASGLPENKLNQLFDNFAFQKGKPSQELNLDDLREIMAEWLQKAFVEIKEGADPAVEIVSSNQLESQVPMGS